MNLSGLVAYRFAGFGVFGYAAYTNPQVADDHSTLFAILWSIFAVVLSFILVFCTYKDDAVKSTSQKQPVCILPSFMNRSVPP